MDNQLIEARKGNITDAVQGVADREGMEAAAVSDLVAAGKAVILSNDRHRNFTPKGVGAGLSIKVNANIGTSSERVNIEDELEKLRVAEEAGADAVMDLSTGGDLDAIRKTRHVPCPGARGHRAHLPGRGPGRDEKGQPSPAWSPTSSSR